MVLPLELRQRIYEYSLAIGITSILKLCKSVKEEATNLIDTSAFLRLHDFEIMQHWIHQLPGNLTPQILSHIKNISITMDTAKTMEILLSYPHRALCQPLAYLHFAYHRTIEIQFVDPCSFGRNVTGIIGTLAGYHTENLFITVKPAVEAEAARKELRFTYVHAFYGCTAVFLKDQLGDPIWHGNDGRGEHYLEFHPHAYQMTLPGEERIEARQSRVGW